MNINELPSNRQGLIQNDSLVDKKKEEMAMEFEKLFARQLVQEMTKGLFESDDKQGMPAGGSGMYRSHVVNTLSEALAKQEKLGMANMVSRRWNLSTKDPSLNPESKIK